MRTHTTLVALTNILKGVPKALHLSTLTDAVETDFNKGVDAAERAYNDALDVAHAAYAAIEEEFDVAKHMIEGAYTRIKALEEAGLLAIEKSDCAQRIETAYKALFGQ